MKGYDGGETRAELYPDSIKMSKQLYYANKRDVKFVVIIGADEIKEDKITVKNMFSGDQKTISFSELIKMFPRDEK